MIIKYIGHAGFSINLERVRLLIDPWLSKEGAFDMGWFQFPENHFIAPAILDETKKFRQNYLYITHEHKDHYDLKFISTLNHANFIVIIPNYRRDKLKRDLKKFPWKKIVMVEDGEDFELDSDCLIRVYLDDSELSRDSAIIVKSKNRVFVNFNDFRKFDILNRIKTEYKEIDVFACQYSGATWHPTCYEYSDSIYANISKDKIENKFNNLIEAIRVLKPKTFIPSAGPPCFLDPELFYINFQEVNIFPKSFEFRKMFKAEIKDIKYLEMMPDDEYCLFDERLNIGASIRINESNYEHYLLSYQSKFQKEFDNRKISKSKTDVKQVIKGFKHILQEKLNLFNLNKIISFPFYIVIFDDFTHKILSLDFQNKLIHETNEIVHKDNFYSMKVHAYEVKQILEKKMTFSDFSLSFRVKINRKPDVYQKLFHGFFLMELEDIEAFCESMQKLSTFSDKCTIVCSGSFYSIDKFCPHEGASLENAIISGNRYLILHFALPNKKIAR